MEGWNDKWQESTAKWEKSNQAPKDFEQASVRTQIGDERQRRSQPSNQIHPFHEMRILRPAGGITRGGPNGNGFQRIESCDAPRHCHHPFEDLRTGLDLAETVFEARRRNDETVKQSRRATGLDRFPLQKGSE